jgi:hypothetical protein
MLRFVPPLRVLGILLALVAVSCRSSEPAAESSRGPASEGAPSSSKAPAVMNTYDIPLYATAPEPKVKVSIQLPSSWKAEIGEKGEPKFSTPGMAGPVFGLVAIPTDQGEPAARIAQAFKWQYEDGAGATREQKPDGRLWASRIEGVLTHSRMFVPVQGGVVMGVAMLRNVTEAQLTEVKATFETIQVIEP